MRASKIRAVLACAAAATTCALAPQAALAGHHGAHARGGVVVTGHDPDYHAQRGGNEAGAGHILQRSIAYVTHDAPAPRILLVTGLRDPGGDNIDSRVGLAAAGFTDVDVADATGAGDALDVRHVAFRRYDVVVVASDYGGWLGQAEVDALTSRSRALIRFVNHGGGLVVLAESAERPTGGDPAISPGVTTGRLGFLPAIAPLATPLSQREVGFTLTPAGVAMGLQVADVNGDPPNVSHLVFTGNAGYDVIDRDAAGRIVTLATRARLAADGAPRCAHGRGQRCSGGHGHGHGRKEHPRPHR